MLEEKGRKKEAGSGNIGNREYSEFWILNPVLMRSRLVHAVSGD
jgi:hypothetical protein